MATGWWAVVLPLKALLSTAVPMPPLKYRIGSAVPWKATIETRRPGSHGLSSTAPATGAKAANRLAMVHASSEVNSAPSDSPVA